MSIQNFEQYNESKSSSFKLTEDEVAYLWNKIELLKKRKAIETENELFKLLNSGKTSFNPEEATKILNALEYSFKKKLKDGTITTEKGKSIHGKLPSDWLGVKFSVIKAKDNKEKKEKEKKDGK